MVLYPAFYNSAMNTARLRESLLAIFADQDMLFDESAVAEYGVDLTTTFQAAPSAVVFPRHELQLQQLVQLARSAQLKLVPSGGRTGYSAGAVASAGEVVVSFERFNQLLKLDIAAKEMVVEPGVTLGTVQKQAKAAGLFFPVDFAPIETCQIGGNISTNAGGINVLHYGNMRQQVKGLRVVTGRGDVLVLGRGLVKNATGYDLMQLFIGAEGTLGFITEATLKLVPQPAPSSVVLMSLQHTASLAELLSELQNIATVYALEFFSHQALQYMLSANQAEAPFKTNAPFYLLCEFSQVSGQNIIEYLRSQQRVIDFIIADEQQQQLALWQYRLKISSALRQANPVKFDIAVRPTDMMAFMHQVDEEMQQYPMFERIWFGHVGDGNLHLNLIANNQQQVSAQLTEEVAHVIYSVVEKFRGAISAEHGVGLLKKPFLHYSVDPAEQAAMQAIKNHFDPDNILNPGKIFN